MARAAHNGPPELDRAACIAELRMYGVGSDHIDDNAHPDEIKGCLEAMRSMRRDPWGFARRFAELDLEDGAIAAIDPRAVRYSALVLAGRKGAARRYLDALQRRARIQSRASRSIRRLAQRHAWRAAPRPRARARRRRALRSVARGAPPDPDGSRGRRSRGGRP